jgi:predicted ABC-type ATPase
VRLDLVVGPNGAGKSTFVRLSVAPARPGVGFVNADIIAAQRWPDDPESHSYEAARIAEATRTALIEQRQPLIAETVFSHPSKLDLLRQATAAGYYTAVHVLMVPEDLAVARVAARVADGGHAVPEEKVRGRFRRLWLLVADAIMLADTATVYDNAQRSGPLAIAVFSHGFPVGNPSWPAWVPDPFSLRWPSVGETQDRGSRGAP